MPRASPGTAIGVDQRRTARELGFTLIEIVIAVAVVAMTVAAGVGISLASRSYAVSAAATEFDHLLDSARTIARETEGVTLAFEPDTYGDGTEVRVLVPGPNGTLTATTLPTFRTRASIEETESLGKAPFAFLIHASGSLGGRPGFRRTAAAPPAEVGCPARGWFHFTIHTAGTTADRFIPCRITLAANGPITFATWPPATIAPLPTPCAGPCTPATLPTAPSALATCPPSFVATLNGCTSAAPTGQGPHYHVTASPASSTLIIGATESITADATLVGDATPGVPRTIPVLVQAASTCSIVPATSQPSGSAFRITGLSTGNCSIIASADTSSVSGATADSMVVAIQVIEPMSSPRPSPSVPSICDLVANGKCYQRIIPRTTQTFWKYVLPDTTCEIIDGLNRCSYIDTIGHLFLAPGYGFQPPIPPSDEAHEILVRIDRISGLLSACQPFSFVGAIPGGDPISWGGNGVGVPLDAADGYGEPSTYVSVNHVISSWTPDGGGFDLDNAWRQGTTLAQLYASVAYGDVGSTYSFTYSAAASGGLAYLQWYPDFPGCDVAGDPNDPGLEFGNAGLSLVFEIFQAMP